MRAVPSATPNADTTNEAPPLGSSGRRSSWRVRLLLVFGSLLVSALLVEIALQLLDPFHYADVEDREAFSAEILELRDGRLRLVPGITSSYLGKEVRINSEGLRNPEVPKAKPADVYRILVIGDSIPFGWGVGQGKCFPRLLGQELKSRGPVSDKSIEVVNGAIPGYGLLEEIKFLEEHGARYQPDLILLMLIPNDVPQHPQPDPPPLFVPTALRGVRVLRLLETLWVRLAHDQPQVPDDPSAALDPQGLKDVCVGLELFQKEARKLNAPVVLLDSLCAEPVTSKCSELGISRIPLKFKPADVRVYAASLTDMHPNEEGHARIAERILRKLPEYLGK